MTCSTERATLRGSTDRLAGPCEATSSNDSSGPEGVQVVANPGADVQQYHTACEKQAARLRRAAVPWTRTHP